VVAQLRRLGVGFSQPKFMMTQEKVSLTGFSVSLLITIAQYSPPMRCAIAMTRQHTLKSSVHKQGPSSVFLSFINNFTKILILLTVL
jgi:hypothetical protein